jgi:proton-coupled amino acid transporter
LNLLSQAKMTLGGEPNCDENARNNEEEEDVELVSSPAAHSDHSSDPSSGTGIINTFQNLVKPFIGAGILALPAAFIKGGVISSSLVMLILAIVANYCIRCLIQCTYIVNEKGWRPSNPNLLISSQHNGDNITNPLIQNETHTNNYNTIRENNSSNYHNGSTDKLLASANHSSNAEVFKIPPSPSFRDIGYLSFGRLGTGIVDVSLIASQLGFCIAYISFISQNMAELSSALSRVEWIILLMCSLSLFCQIRSMARLAFASVLGNLIYFISLSIIFYDGFANHCCSSHIPLLDISGLPFVFGTACFALEGIGLILPVKRAMKNQSKFSSLLNSAIGLVTALYISFALLGVLFYGRSVNSSITQNMTAGAATDTVRVALSISLFFSFVIQMFPVLEITDTVINNLACFQLNDSSSSLAERNSLQSVDSSAAPSLSWLGYSVQCLARVSCVVLVCVIAIVFKNFGLVVSLVGSLANSMIAFILPQLFFIQIALLPKYHSEHVRNWKPFVLPITVVLMGITASIIGVYFSIKAAVSGDDS